MEEVTYEKPLKYTPNNVIYWEPVSKALMIAGKAKDKHAKPLLTKAKKFLLSGCIKELSGTTWACEPLRNYNKTTYFIRSIMDEFYCTCQGFNKKLKEYKEGKTEIKPICSHIVAVKQFCFIKAHNDKKVLL